MQEKKWLRVGLATLIVGGAIGGMAAAGCSGDDNTGTPTKDGGSDHSVADSSSGGNPETGSDTGKPGDSGGGGDGEAGPGVPNAKVFLVHAAVDPNAPPFRFCFGLGNAADGGTVTVAGGIDPFPDFKLTPTAPVAGLFPGFGGSTANSAQLAAFDLSTLTISLYALNAASPLVATDTADGGPDGGAEIPCEGLIGSDGLGTAGTGHGILTMGTDYWYVGTIPQGTLAHGTTWVAAVGGCAPGLSAQQGALCPAGYSAATGNLQLIPYKVDSTTAVDGGLGAQFANTSFAYDTVLGTVGGAASVPGLYIPTPVVPSDGGGAEGGEAGPPPSPITFVPIAASAAAGATLYPATLATVPGVTYDGGSGFFLESVGADGGTVLFPPGCNPALGNCYSPLLLPLPIIDQLTYGGAAPAGGTFADGKGYAFVFIGDPTQLPFIGADGGGTSTNTGVPNGKSPHFLAFPTSNP
jgi:hypothetical protein